MTTAEWIDVDREEKRAKIMARMSEIAKEVHEKRLWWIRNTGQTPTRVYLRESDYQWIMDNAEIITGQPVALNNVMRFAGMNVFVSDQEGPYVCYDSSDLS